MATNQEPPSEKSGVDLNDLFQLDRVGRADQSTAFSWVALDNFIRQSRDMLHSAKWHRAQVDALIKRNEKECGHEGTYQPPTEDDGDDVNNSTFMNNTIISDNALNKILKAIENPVEPPTQPPTQPPVQPPVSRDENPSHRP